MYTVGVEVNELLDFRFRGTFLIFLFDYDQLVEELLTKVSAFIRLLENHLERDGDWDTCFSVVHLLQNSNKLIERG